MFKMPKNISILIQTLNKTSWTKRNEKILSKGVLFLTLAVDPSQ